MSGNDNAGEAMSFRDMKEIKGYVWHDCLNLENLIGNRNSQPLFTRLLKKTKMFAIMVIIIIAQVCKCSHCDGQMAIHPHSM